MEQTLTPLHIGTEPLPEQLSNPSDETFEAILNRERGKLKGYDCPICLNRGFIWHVEDGEKWTEKCKCMKTRVNLARLEKSGLTEAARHCTFDSFEANTEWQRRMKEAVLSFVRDRERGWLFVSGQSGCGKTHLCTAAVMKFILAGGVTARYVCWIEAKQQMQAALYDQEAYDAILLPLKRCRVLYLDDLFKTERNEPPKEWEYRLAMELINARYNAPSLITIISTEHTMQELFAMDEALAGRIAERAAKYIVQVAHQPDRNYRLRYIGGAI